MSKHASGPWRPQSHKDDDGNMLFCSIVDDYNREVANTATGNFGDENEYANANLIAAAPEMLEMLERAKSWCYTHSMQTYSKAAQECGDEIKKLIKKAKGIS